jgi:hypothetical protein
MSQNITIVIIDSEMEDKCHGEPVEPISPFGKGGMRGIL